MCDGFQWIDGSFVEDVETSQKRPPADIDIVTFAPLPSFPDSAARQTWIKQNLALFDTTQTKDAYQCDAYFVDLGKRPDLLVDDSRYWFGLFSHQRGTSLWKGMIQIPMVLDDDSASDYLDTITFATTEVENA